MAFLDSILALITSAACMSATLAVVLEFVLRLIPSEKPMSIAHLVGAFIKKLGEVCVAVGGLLDRVLPQKLK